MSETFQIDKASIAEIGARFGVSPPQIVPIAGGEANQTWRLGSRFILRLPRDEQAAIDLRKESIVIPAARAAGVLTPAIVAFDDSGALLPAPFMVLERCPGADLTTLEGDRPGQSLPGVMTETGRHLARLHRITLAATAWASAVPVDHDGTDPRLTIEQLASLGLIGAGDAGWISNWFDRLSRWLPEPPELVLIHGDLATQNLMVNMDDDPHGARLTGIIDWGDAAWADPAVDFAKLRLDDVPAALTGYLEGALADDDVFTVWSARILWHQLAWAIGRLEAPTPRPGARHWTAPPYSRLFHLLRFFHNTPSEPWRSLAPPQ